VTLACDVTYGTRHPWVPGAPRIRAWATAAAGRFGPRATLAVRIATPGESARLNERYRGKPYATNVLSFPVERDGVVRGEPRPLGDLVICARVVAKEAREQGKTLSAHWAHMVVHGVLHLLGYDHIDASDARRMESRERRLLADFGIADPYGERTDG
jgi:probable rRNA maturation factor